MLNLNDRSQKILNFISLSFLDGHADLSVDTPLMDLNILDSASVFDVVDFVLSEFNVRIPLREIHPENFHSVVKLEQLINRLALME
ncbi:MAG: acyl carrier protein [Gammaproteobacteria bacterium]|nr:acyl carrier protein [Gammaproteobacteria bacterium]